MTRHIAILTLALTAVLSVDQAFAQYGTDTCHVDEYGTISMAAIAFPNLIEVIVDVDPYLGYRILRKEGFTDQEARGVVLLVIVALHADTDELAPSKHILGQANGLRPTAPSKYVLGQANGLRN